MREHNEAVNRLDVIPGRDPITAEYAPGAVREVRSTTARMLRLRKLARRIRRDRPRRAR